MITLCSFLRAGLRSSCIARGEVTKPGPVAGVYCAPGRVYAVGVVTRLGQVNAHSSESLSEAADALASAPGEADEGPMAFEPDGQVAF